jgi:hypothetical protein
MKDEALGVVAGEGSVESDERQWTSDE